MNFLKQPYPYFHGGRELLRNGLLILILSFLFEYLFEPFNINMDEHRFDYWLIVLIHSGQSAITYLILFLLIGLFIDRDEWRIYKEILAMGLVLFQVGSNGFFLRDLIYDNPENGKFGYYIEEVKNTMLVGSIIIFVIIVVNFNLLNRKNQQRANRIPLKQNWDPINQKIEIKANVSSDHFELFPSNILCIRSAGNYLEFYVYDDISTQKILKRLTLQSALDQLENYPNIIKTHRTFIVNINHLENVAGNAQGYQLSIKNLDFTVPVSRGHIQAFNKMVG